eukprot:Pgem_evm1s18051
MVVLRVSWDKVVGKRDESDFFPLEACQKLFYSRLFKLCPEAKKYFPTLKEKANMFTGLMKTIYFI